MAGYSTTVTEHSAHHVRTDVEQFFARLDRVATQYLEPHDAQGHPDLPGYHPSMGPRYSVKGFAFPLSVFRGEGIALFLIAQALHPTVVAECYTGTGYAACCLAAGAPDAQVYTVDNYTEGSLGEAGVRNSETLRNSLGLTNLRCLHGTVDDLRQDLSASVNLYLSDGPYGDSPELAEDVVHIRHDDTHGQVDGRRFVIQGGSHMSVTCPTIEMREWLMQALSPHITVKAA